MKSREITENAIPSLPEKDLLQINYNHIRYQGFIKSVGRAIRRGRLSIQGYLVPKRPFNNRSNTSNRAGVHSRTANEFKKQLYESIRRVN